MVYVKVVVSKMEIPTFYLKIALKSEGVNSNLILISLQSFSFPSVSRQCFISLRENLLGFI